MWLTFVNCAPADVELGPGLKGLIASVMDPPLISVLVAGIPRASALAITEAVPPSSVHPVLAVAILSVWAAHYTPEAFPIHKSVPESSPVHESASEASLIHSFAPEAFPP